MANKKVRLELTPVMSLSIMAIFFMSFTLVSLGNSQKRAQASRAAVPAPVLEEEPVTSPTPSPKPAYKR